MKKQLLIFTLVILLAIGIVKKTKAAETADSTLRGTLATGYEVTATNGIGIISSSDGSWTTINNPGFEIASNSTNYTIRISAVAGDSGASQALGVPQTPAFGKVRLAVAKLAATSAAVANAIDNVAATSANNIDVIAYDVSFAGTEVVFNTFVSTPLLGSIHPAGLTVITGTVGALGNGTFSTTTDTAGTYTATIHLVASDT